MGAELDLTALRRYLEGRDEVVVAYLFGSHARGEADARSDVDIALLLRPDLPDVFRLKPRLDTKIGDVLDSDEVDVLFLNDAPLPLRAEVVRTGQIIVSKDEEVRVEFEARTMSAWWDFQPLLAEFDRLYLASLKRGFTDEQWRIYHTTRELLARAHP
jgi:hypothetical protein